jgi:hypothetical protein
MSFPMWLIAGFALLGAVAAFSHFSAVSQGFTSLHARLERQEEGIAALNARLGEVSENLERLMRQLEDMQRSPAERERREWPKRFDRATPLRTDTVRSLGAGSVLRLIQQAFIDAGTDSFFDYSQFDFRFEYRHEVPTDPNIVRLHGYRKDDESPTWEPCTLICDGEETSSASPNATVRVIPSAS